MTAKRPFRGRTHEPSGENLRLTLAVKQTLQTAASTSVSEFILDALSEAEEGQAQRRVFTARRRIGTPSWPRSMRRPVGVRA